MVLIMGVAVGSYPVCILSRLDYYLSTNVMEGDRINIMGLCIVCVIVRLTGEPSKVKVQGG